MEIPLSIAQAITIDSYTFFRFWKNACQTDSSSLIHNWSCSADYTECIYPIVENVAEAFGLKYCHEYYKIDSVFYKEVDLVPGTRPQNTWLRRIRVAFEHENDFFSGLYQEVSHLLITNCDLRVLVTYCPDYDSQIDDELGRLHGLISGVKGFQEISDNGSFLIVMGWREEKVVEWYGWIYRKEKWESLE